MHVDSCLSVYMLHATRPPPHAWPVMSQPGPDLLIHHPHQPHGTRNGAHPSQGDHLKTDTTMGHHIDAPTHLPGPSPVFNNVNSFYNPHHTGFNIFPPSSYTVHHPASRPSSREPEGQGSLRHPSGGSVTGGSGGSHTPPSPEENRQNMNPMPSYKQSVIMDRNSTARTSFEQRQCNSAGSENQTQGVTQGSPAPANGSAPPTPYRMQPPSPANLNMPQKSPFDMTTNTMGLSKSIPNFSSSHSIIAHSPGTTSSAFSSSGRPGSVISSVRMPASPYQSSVNIKQEPGSPAQYAPANRAVKQEPPNQPSPNSPRTVNATPPPSHPHPHGYPQSMERKLIQNRIPHGTQGFNFPSPQPHGGNSHPISPAANIGDTNPRPVNKFRYPSGPQPVQNLSPGESNSNSAMSSREGTPGPTRQSWCGEESSGPAPNVDISSVQVKEEFGLGLMRYEPSNSSGNDYSRRPSINLSYPAATTSVSSHIDSYSSHPGYGAYHHAMPQQVALPPRSFHPMRPGSVHPGLHGSGIPGRPLSLPGNSEHSSSHSNVKIGRRPAHLPKVLKFSDNTLPHGWVRKLKQRKHGKQAGRWDVYIYSPCGVKFASRKKLRNFFEKNNLQYDPEDFDFTPYGRHIEQSAHARHHSSNENVHRHVGSSGSPSSVSSPSSSYNSPGIHPEFKSEFLSPPAPNPPTAHRPHSYIHPHQPPMFSDYNPMMESPPNANALEVPQHQILNLSQPQPIANSISRASSTPILATSHPAPVSNFPPDIATILNEPSDNQFRQSLREYQNDLSSRHPPVEPMANDDSMHVDESGNMEDKKEAMGEDNRFMTRTYNLLTASQGDLGDMMDEYSIYPE